MKEERAWKFVGIVFFKVSQGGNNWQRDFNLLPKPGKKIEVHFQLTELKASRAYF